MKILQVDEEIYKIFSNSLKVTDVLPANVYSVGFHPQNGFYLKVHNPLTVTEKLYGNHEQKVDKILKAYSLFERSLGVIFSGDKGIGKSIAARMLCEKALALGYPVILIENNYAGLAQYIDSINQECVILFDEFEKIFKKHYDRDEGESDYSNQEKLLNLFDGTSKVKHLYIITCNNIWDISSFITNRPGRFHYHIRWQYPSEDEIIAYMKDKVDEKYHNEINNVIEFATKVTLNYDCLRAISFELNMGLPFKEAIADLNIKNTEHDYYNIHVIFEDGSEYKTSETLDLFDNKNRSFWFNCVGNRRDELLINIYLGDIRYINGKLVLDKDKIFVEDIKETKKVKEAWIEKVKEENYEYKF